jgi:hypothetical protein
MTPNHQGATMTETTITDTDPTPAQVEAIKEIMTPAVVPLERPPEHKRSQQVIEAEAANAQRARRPRSTSSVGKIARAIADITAEVGVVKKAGVNQFHRYKYAQMQDVLQALTPVMAKHGLIIIQTEVARARFDDDRTIAIDYEFTIALAGCDDVWPDRPKQTGVSKCRDSKGNFDDKAFNKCHTAARKYFLMALFQIATDDSDDADAGRNDGPQQRAAPNVVMHDPETGEIAEPPKKAEEVAKDIVAQARTIFLNEGIERAHSFARARSPVEQVWLRKNWKDITA